EEEAFGSVVPHQPGQVGGGNGQSVQRTGVQGHETVGVVHVYAWNAGWDRDRARTASCHRSGIRNGRCEPVGPSGGTGVAAVRAFRGPKGSPGSPERGRRTASAAGSAALGPARSAVLPEASAPGRGRGAPVGAAASSGVPEKVAGAPPVPRTGRGARRTRRTAAWFTDHHLDDRFGVGFPAQRCRPESGKHRGGRRREETGSSVLLRCSAS